MSGLVTRLAMRMPKRAANAQEGTTPRLEVLGGKHSKPSRFNEEVQADPMVITIDSLERVLEAHFVVRGTAQDASRKACVALEDESPTEEFPHVDEASLVEAIGESPPWAR